MITNGNFLLKSSLFSKVRRYFCCITGVVHTSFRQYMLQVSIPVHPLSLRALRAAYGQGPIVLSNHDTLFTFLTCSPLRSRMTSRAMVLSSEATFVVNNALAQHLQANACKVGAALFKFHKLELCRFAASAVILGYKGGAKAGLYVWLRMNGVGEDEYSLDSAYKLWQRFGWKFCAEKSTTFLSQINGKAAGIMAKKQAIMPKSVKPLQPRSLTLSQIEIELAANRFTESVKRCFRRPPHKLSYHARIYYYSLSSGMSARDLSKYLSIPVSSITYASRTIRKQALQNLTLSRLLSDALPDAATAPAPSGHGTSAPFQLSKVHQNARLTYQAGHYRSSRSGEPA